MTALGTGSAYAPIIISDDEDDEEMQVQQYLIGHSSAAASKSLWDSAHHNDGTASASSSKESPLDRKRKRTATASSTSGPTQKIARVPANDAPARLAFRPAIAPPNQASGSSISKKKQKKQKQAAAKAAKDLHALSSHSSFLPPDYWQSQWNADPPWNGPNTLNPWTHAVAPSMTMGDMPLAYLSAIPLPPKPSAFTTSMAQILSEPASTSALTSPVAVPQVTPPQELPASVEDMPAETAPLARKLIGMHPDNKPSNTKRGIFHSLIKNSSVPDASRSLVMELMPKKWRVFTFVQSWAKRFDKQPVRVELDNKVGKALIEFRTAESARAAFNSSRLVGDGKEHIRVWWYRLDPAMKDLEEGEVYEPAAHQAGPSNQNQLGKKATKGQKGKERAPLPPQIPAPSASLSAKQLASSQQLSSARPKSRAIYESWLRSFYQEPPQENATPTSAFASPGARQPEPSFESELGSPPSPGASSPYHDDEAEFFYPEDVEMDLGTDDGYERDGIIPIGHIDFDDALPDNTSSYSPEPPESVQDDIDGFGEDGSRSRVWRLAHPQETRDEWQDDESIASSRHSSPRPVRQTGQVAVPADVEKATARPSTSSPPKKALQMPKPLTYPQGSSSLEPTSKANMTSVPVSAPALSKSVRSVESTKPLLQIAMAAPEVEPEKASQSAVTPESSRTTSPFDLIEAFSLKGSADILIGPPSKGRPAPVAAMSLPAVFTSFTQQPSAPTTPLPISTNPSLVADSPLIGDPSPSWSGSQPSTPSESANNSLPPAKLSLLARQKELEARIAQAKAELARKTVARASPPPTPPLPAPAPSLPSPALVPAPSQATESKDVGLDQLRRAVVENRRKFAESGKGSTVALTSTTATAPTLPAALPSQPLLTITSAPVGEDDSLPSSTPSVDSSTRASTPVAAAVAPPVITMANVHSAASLEDMAVSFITETIQKMDPPPLQYRPSSEKVLLAAKQQMLEQHITETKSLMEKLSAAKTKEERENIMSMLRERTRAMDEDMQAQRSTPPLRPPSVRLGQAVVPAKRKRWPETAHSSFVLIISDDEDEDEI